MHGICVTVRVRCSFIFVCLCVCLTPCACVHAHVQDVLMHVCWNVRLNEWIYVCNRFRLLRVCGWLVHAFCVHSTHMSTRITYHMRDFILFKYETHLFVPLHVLAHLRVYYPVRWLRVLWFLLSCEMAAQTRVEVVCVTFQCACLMVICVCVWWICTFACVHVCLVCVYLSMCTNMHMCTEVCTFVYVHMWPQPGCKCVL